MTTTRTTKSATVLDCTRTFPDNGIKEKEYKEKEEDEEWQE